VPNTKQFSDLTREIRTNPARMARVNAYRRTMEAMLEVTRAREERADAPDELASAIDAWKTMDSGGEDEVALHLTTLRSYVEALGGELELTARFPDGDAIRLA
jgi:hypothetical protein